MDLIIAAVNMICGLIIGYFVGRTKEREAWNKVLGLPPKK